MMMMMTWYYYEGDQRVRTHSECTLIQQFVCKLPFLIRKQNSELLFHVFALKVSVCYECMPSAQNSVLCEQNHRETALCTSASVWHLWPPSYFFQIPKRWKSLSAKISIAWQMAALSQNFGWECVNIHHIVLTWHQVTLSFQSSD